MDPKLLLIGLLLSSVSVGAQDAIVETTVGTLDFFGLRRVTEADVRTALKLKEGDPFARSSVRSLAEEVEKIPGVGKASIAPISVDGSGKLRIFIGIQENQAPGFSFRDPPEGEQRLPGNLAQLYADFIAGLGPAVRRGGGREDHSQGHALSDDPELRKSQLAAISAMAASSTTLLVKEVLRASRHPEDRRAAAWLLGYAPDKNSVVTDLIAAARDPDSTVRNNATRALGAIVTLANAQPALGISIPPDVFIDMLHSVTWTDRNKVSFLLDGLTKTNDPDLLRALRERALPELIEMARWKSEGHAFPAIRILGRIAGWKDQDTLRLAREGDLNKLIAAASAPR